MPRLWRVTVFAAAIAAVSDAAPPGSIAADLNATIPKGRERQGDDVASLCTGAAELAVEVLVFSGTENPSFRLGGKERGRFCSILHAAAAKGAKRLWRPSCRVLGFQGWRVCASPAVCISLLAGPQAVEALLLRAFRRNPGRLQAPQRSRLVGHIQAETRHLRRSGEDEWRCPQYLEVAPAAAPAVDCSATVRGPDAPLQVHFSPRHDDGGCFIKQQAKNNCYNYANDIVTNTFAQPGRASGLCPPSTHPCVNNTCQDVRRAAEADGLVWVGTQLPRSLPQKGHYVSLHIWPDTNFHWLRMDANMFWSHKPGGSPVTKVDNKHRKIHDPSRADLSPWSTHCGYMLTVPSGVRLQSAAGQAHGSMPAWQRLQSAAGQAIFV